MAKNQLRISFGKPQEKLMQCEILENKSYGKSRHKYLCIQCDTLLVM